ncbi:pantoate-beta-alanine ligase [Diplocarpon rosae]|nr:pantoate-beta-alanine ligase [Diplocarpon rosae]
MVALATRQLVLLTERKLATSKSCCKTSRAFSASGNVQARSRDQVIPNTSIRVFREIPALRQWRSKQLHNYRSIGLVPTMGALHEGHLSLIRLAAKENSSVVVSIYVNPTQFGVHEDLDSYPKTWTKDVEMLRDLDMEMAADSGNLGNIAAVFAPTTEEMYPSGPPSQDINGKGSFVTITPAGELLEGASRPTFFRGVATVCMKLFNIVAPERVYFGQKDVQQTVVIKQMVKEFRVDTQVIVGETKREPDGLAMSSRNIYLGARRRKSGNVLSKGLRVAEAAYLRGARTRDQVLGPAKELLEAFLEEQLLLKPEERVGFEIDYMSLADPDTMHELDKVDEPTGAIISGAVKMLPVESPQPGEDLGLAGGPPVRLIDNIILKPMEA